MGFPQTRLTLIKRLTAEGHEQDWRTFHDDYWGAVCRFVMRWGRLSIEDAEDVAADTFQAILTNNLLVRWQEHHTSKLRTLICGVARNIVANRARVAGGRKRILQDLSVRGDLPASLWSASEPSNEPEDVFYSAWSDELLGRAVDGLVASLHREGKGDYFRVLHGRVCEQLSTREIAELLGISITTAENRFKAAKKRLASELEAAIHRHVERYSTDDVVADEFAAEWSRLSDHLQEHGGLETVLRARHEEAISRNELNRNSKKYRETQTAYRRQPHL